MASKEDGDVDTIITGGTLATPTELRKASIAIDGERIVAVGDERALPSARNRYDATGQIVMPGVVDPHVHIDETEQRAGSYETETAAAAAGGVTTVIDFAWQGGDRSLDGNSVSLLDGIEHKKGKRDQAYVDYGLHSVLLRQESETLDQLGDAIEAGVTSFKMFMSTYETGVDTGFIDRAFHRIAEHDAVAAVHTENPSICDSQRERLRRESKGDAIYYPESRPDYAEAIGAGIALRLALESNVKYYGVHTSCRKAAAEIARYQRHSNNIRAETCTHYTALDESVHAKQGSLPLIAPPIRKPDDVDAVFEHLENGTLSVVSTDHVPYTRKQKEAEHWWDVPYGANSLQWSLPVFHHEAVVERDFSYPFLVRVMSTTPARTFGMPQKGTLQPGSDADIVVFDPDESQTVTASTNESGSTFSMYEGREVTGTVKKTFVRGDLVIDDGNLVGEPGSGRFLEREIPDWSAR